MMNRRLVFIPLFLILVSTTFIAMLDKSTTLLVYANGSPDSYGNRILSMYVYWWNGTDYVLDPNGVCHASGWYAGPGGMTWHVYNPSSPYEWHVHDNTAIKIVVQVLLNTSLATSASEAIDNTRLYLNITNSGGYSLTNEQFSDVGNAANETYGGNYWWRVPYEYVWNATGHPNAGVSYDVVVWYEAYY